MSSKGYPGSKGPHAESIPISPIPGSNADTVQEALSVATDAASPGFSFGRQNIVSNGAWLLNESTPSNKAGRPILLDDPVLTRIAVTNEIANTFEVSIYEHDGVTFTFLDNITLTAERSKVKDGISVSATKGKELAARITSGSAENIIVTLSVRGVAN